jgi:hypothetical protein
MSQDVQRVASTAGAIPVGPRLVLALLLAAASLAGPSAQGSTDLDAFMSRVMSRRDDNWKKLQQYVLEEREVFQIIGPGNTIVFGMRRESAWFPRDGMFVKSLIRADGVTLSDAERRKSEADWLKREQMREKWRAERAKKLEEANNDTAPTTPLTEEGVRQALEPGFVSAAYFLRFKFDPGQYALVGREKLEGRDVLKIEYYPTKLFNEGRTRPNKELRKREQEIDQKMNKVAQVTLWIDPAEHQILKYDFQNMEMDFLPARQIVRIDRLDASMEMGQPFPSVWLPRSLRIGADMTLAIGQLDGRYTVDYYDYKLADVTTRVR